MSSLIIAGRNLGKRQRVLFDDFSIPFPPQIGDGDGLTLRELISLIVVGEVEAFRTRQEARCLARVLSTTQIEKGVERGKVESGVQELSQEVDEADAVATALQAFEDGLYLVIIDGVEHRNLDAQVYIQPGSRITFVRLVFLAGA